MFRGEYLNAIRGFAALLVFWMHLVTIPTLTQINFEKTTGISKYIWSLVSAGYTGVGFFIFLSGYLLTLSNIRHNESFLRYMTYRWLRIYPVYLIVLFVAIVASRQWDWHGFLNALFLFPNLPGTLWPFPYLATAWSLGIEWSLYFCLYFLILVNSSRNRNKVALHSLFLGLMVLASIQGTDKHTIVYGSLLGRMIQFSLGSLFAVLLHRNFQADSIKLMKQRRLMVPLFVILYSTWSIFSMNNGSVSSNGMWRLASPYIECLLCALLIFWSETARKSAPKITKMLSFLGKISYPFYLIHVTVLYGINTKLSILSSESYWPRFALIAPLSLVISIIVSYVFHVAIEEPIEKWKASKRMETR